MTDIDVNDLGPNAGLVEEMFRRYQENPSSIAPAWQEFFAVYTPRGAVAATAPTASAATPPAAAAPAPAPPTAPSGNGASAKAPVVLEGEAPQPLRGPAKAIVSNMEASLGV